MIYDVVIAGAGPVGLFLACELRLANRSVLVLEQAEDPRSALKRLPFGLRGLSVPTVEAFYRRGLLDQIAAGPSGQPGPGGGPGAAHWMRQARRPAGHFAGIQFYQDRIDDTRWPYRLPGPAAHGMAVEMEHLESVLAARAIGLGAQLRRGLGVEDLDAADEFVDVRAGADVFRGRWLVGCDGGRSSVRKAAGLAFAGTDPEFTGYSAQIALADPERLAPGRHYTATGMYMYQPPGTLAMVDFDGGAFHRTQPITREHVQAVLRRVSGTEASVTALELATTWTDRAYQATAYRQGRVLLAGDAAHIHSPLGGQGLNLGLGDAMNLAWKLAASLRGDAPAGLLDTYAGERHPIGAQVLDWSRAQVALMRPSPSSRALEAIVRDLIDTRDGATYFAKRVWGTALRYDLGDEHPLVGRSAPDFEWIDGSSPAADRLDTGSPAADPPGASVPERDPRYAARLGALLAEGKGVLVDFDARPSLQALAARWNGRIAYVGRDARQRLGLSALLVRPDGVVAWAGDGAADPEAAARAARLWFGEPR